MINHVSSNFSNRLNLSSSPIFKWPNGLTLYFILFSFFFFLWHSSHQITIIASHLPWLCFSRFPFSSALPQIPSLMHQPISFLLFLPSVSNTPKSLPKKKIGWLLWFVQPLFNEVFYQVWTGPTVLWCTQQNWQCVRCYLEFKYLKWFFFCIKK